MRRAAAGLGIASLLVAVGYRFLDRFSLGATQR